MLEILQFIFQDFIHFIGSIFLILTVGVALNHFDAGFRGKVVTFR